MRPACVLLQETAINIGYACSLITDDMTQFQLTGSSEEVEALEAAGQVRRVIARRAAACYGPALLASALWIVPRSVLTEPHAGCPDAAHARQP